MPYKDKNKQKAAQAAHYQRNKQHFVDKLRTKRNNLMEWIFELKSSLKCCRCPENHPACLDFHHVNEATKVADIARMVRDAYSKESILEEIKKCIVLCANCHRKQHFYTDKRPLAGTVTVWSAKSQ